MLRSFLPVGQGAFYREVFGYGEEKCTIVYDCGTSTDKRIVEKLIHNEFVKNEKIDAVFISHLDEDHINGLPYLLKYCKVENLFFPLITDSDKIYLKLKALLLQGSDSFLFKLIENPYNIFRNLDNNHIPQIYQIDIEQNESEYNYNFDDKHVLSGGNINHILNLNEFEDYSWELVPFNFRQETRIKQLKNAVVKIFGCKNDEVEDKLEELIRDFPNNIDKIKETYNLVNGSFNTNSLTLFSGTRKHNIRQRYAVNKCYCDGRCYFPKKENGCLYLGDYDASGKQKWDSLKKAYYEYWSYIGCIQIPHHGSSYNYNKEISNLNAIYVISAGNKNRYYHPHSSVIKDLIMNNRKVHIITEDIGSQLDLKVVF